MDSVRKKIVRPAAPLRPRPAPAPLPDPPPAPRLRPLPRRRFPFGRAFLILLAGFLSVLVGSLAFLAFKGVAVSRTISVENRSGQSLFAQMRALAATLMTEKRSPLRGEADGRINILLLGRAGEHYPGRDLTDTVMVMSLDTRAQKVALLSFPRDLFVPIPHTGLSTKLNALYQYGEDNGLGVAPVEECLGQIAGLPIHYFITVDFDGFEQAVNAIGGIGVDVTRDFYDPRYPGKNYSYELFEIKRGWQTLDGATALKYVRERHNDPEGDFGRAKRQQQVIQAIKDKVFSARTYTNVFALNRLLDTLGGNVRTDMTVEEMGGFLELARTLDTRNVTSVVVDAWQPDSLLRVSHLQVGSTAAFILVPRVGNWSEVTDLAQNLFHLDALHARRDRIAAEAPALALLYTPADAALAHRIAAFLGDALGFGTVRLVPAPALAERPSESMMVDRSHLSKPYSLDELKKRFPLTDADTLPDGISPPEDADFSLLIGASLAHVFSFDENAGSPPENDTLDAAPLPPQPTQP